AWIPVAFLDRPQLGRARVDQTLPVRVLGKESQPRTLLDLGDRDQLRPMVVDMAERPRLVAVDPGRGGDRDAIAAGRVWLLEDERKRVDARGALVHDDLEEGIGDLDAKLARIANGKPRGGSVED